MGFTDAIKTCFSKYVTFSGRARRSEYWYFVLFIVLSSIVFSLIDSAIFGVPEPTATSQNGPLTSLFNLAILLPLAAAAWRRMHDTGRPGWFVLIPMLISVSTFVMLMFGVMSFGAMDAAGMGGGALRGIAGLLGATGIMVMMVLQLIVAVLMLWWLTRPSDPGDNEYGPAPA